MCSDLHSVSSECTNEAGGGDQRQPISVPQSEVVTEPDWNEKNPDVLQRSVVTTWWLCVTSAHKIEQFHNWGNIYDAKQVCS